LDFLVFLGVFAFLGFLSTVVDFLGILIEDKKGLFPLSFSAITVYLHGLS
jgi:hypothetical protein